MASDPSLPGLPGALLQAAILDKLDPRSMLQLSCACRSLRHASRAWAWRVELDLSPVRNPIARLLHFVDWVRGGHSGPARTVTQLRLQALCRGLATLPTLDRLDSGMSRHWQGLASLSGCTSLTELRVAVAHSSKFPGCWAGYKWPHPCPSLLPASQSLQAGLEPLRGLVSLDLAGFMQPPQGRHRLGGVKWLPRLTQLTRLRVYHGDVDMAHHGELSAALLGLPRLLDLHVEGERDDFRLARFRMSWASQVTRLTLESCHLTVDHCGSLRELRLLGDFYLVERAAVLPPPPPALSKLCIVFKPSCDFCNLSDGLVALLMRLSNLRELSVAGAIQPTLLRDAGLLPHLHTLRLGLRKAPHVKPGSFRCCFQPNLPALRSLTLELSQACSQLWPLHELQEVAAHGCSTRVVLLPFEDWSHFWDDSS